MKTPKKTEKTVKLVKNPTEDKKDTNKTHQGKNFKISSKRNATPNTNTISKIQVSDSDQSIDMDDNENDLIGWTSLPNMVTTSEDSDSSDTDGTE